jgi:hypothetical protein
MPELTEAERTMIAALAQVVIVDRLKRAVEVGTTSKGRIICEFVGEPSEAEKKWEEIRARFAPPPSVIKGGPHKAPVTHEEAWKED